MFLFTRCPAKITGKTYSFSFTVNRLAGGPRLALNLFRQESEVEMTESKSADWRELCAAAVNEHDATKLTCLVNQIIQAFDEALMPRESKETTFPQTED